MSRSEVNIGRYILIAVVSVVTLPFLYAHFTPLAIVPAFALLASAMVIAEWLFKIDPYKKSPAKTFLFAAVMLGTVLLIALLLRDL